MVGFHRTVVYSTVFAAAAFRLLPHPPNFTPVAAVALCAGAFLWERKWLALCLPVMVMLVSDLFLGFHKGMLFSYPALIAAVLLGPQVKRECPVLSIGMASLQAAFIFFILSNLGVWWIGDLYPPTFSGLLLCYAMAVPFFGSFLLSTLLFASVMFPVLWNLHSRFLRSETASPLQHC